MKKNLFILVLFIFTSISIFAQEQKKGKVKIIIDNNGKTEIIEEDFNGEMPADVKQKIEEAKKKLKEQGIELKMPNIEFKEGEDSNIFFYKFENNDDEIIEFKEGDIEKNFDIDMNFDENTKSSGKIKIYINKNGNEEIIEKEFGEGLPEDIKEKMENFKFDIRIDSDKLHFGKEGFEFEEGENVEVEEFELKDGKRVKVITSRVIIITDSKEEEGAAEESEEAEEFIQDFKLYPNPSGGEFNLKFNLQDKGNADIAIYDLQGNVKYRNTLENFSGTYDEAINLGNTKEGIYILKVIQNGKTFTRQIAVE